MSSIDRISLGLLVIAPAVAFTAGIMPELGGASLFGKLLGLSLTVGISTACGVGVLKVCR